MASCLHPRTIKNPLFGRLRNASGKLVCDGQNTIDRYLQVPCGRCLNCLVNRQNDWAMRLDYESRQYPNSSFFVTLTYDDANLPYEYVIAGETFSTLNLDTGEEFPTLNKAHLQKFVKRLRKAGLEFRYFFCGEYGDKFGRPHYHGIFFVKNYPFETLNSEYLHDFLIKFWTYCEPYEVDVQRVSVATMEYVAKYSAKRFGVDYEHVQPPFSLSSNRGIEGAIGSWVLRNKDFVRQLKINQSYLVYNTAGEPRCLPRYIKERVFTYKERDQIRKNYDSYLYLLDIYKSKVQQCDNVEHYRANQMFIDELVERQKISEKCKKDFGKFCKMDYISYIASVIKI